MLKRWTVLPAIHIMNPIIIRFLNGACATSQAFCSHQGAHTVRQQFQGYQDLSSCKTARYSYHIIAGRSRWPRPGSTRPSTNTVPIERTCAFHAVSESLRWRAPAASSCEPEQARELRETEPNQRRGERGGGGGVGVTASGADLVKPGGSGTAGEEEASGSSTAQRRARPFPFSMPAGRGSEIDDLALRRRRFCGRLRLGSRRGRVLVRVAASN